MNFQLDRRMLYVVYILCWIDLTWLTTSAIFLVYFVSVRPVSSDYLLVSEWNEPRSSDKVFSTSLLMSKLIFPS